MFNVVYYSIIIRILSCSAQDLCAIFVSSTYLFTTTRSYSYLRNSCPRHFRSGKNRKNRKIPKIQVSVLKGSPTDPLWTNQPPGTQYSPESPHTTICYPNFHYFPRASAAGTISQLSRSRICLQVSRALIHRI